MSEKGPSKLAELAETVDGITRERAANLSARGLLDGQVADILLLTIEQLKAIKETEEFKKTYHAEADRQIQEQLDRDEGWDGVETLALETLLTTMKFNRDPKFALFAAKTANAAERRSRASKERHTIEAPAASQQSNVIMITINKNYASKEKPMVDISPRPASIPLKQSDMPAPKLVEQILAPAKHKAEVVLKNQNERDLAELFKASGVVFDADE